MLLKPNSALQLFIIAEVFNSKSKGTTGYNITKDYSDFWNHQQVYRECNSLSQAGILFPTIVNNEGKPDSKVYLLADDAKDKLNDFMKWEILPHLNNDGSMDEFWGQAYAALLTTELIDCHIVQELDVAYLSNLERQYKQIKEGLDKVTRLGSMYRQRLQTAEYKIRRFEKFSGIKSCVL